MKSKVAVIAFVAALALAGCSSLNPLADLVGSKPDLTAQVGAENTKQTLGLNNKTDTSSKNETTIKDSNVDKVDTSTKKKVTATSLTADIIQADTIQISNRDSEFDWRIVAIAALIALVVGVGIGRKFGIRK